MATIRPFRDYSEHEVINLFALQGESNKGTFVTAAASGFDLTAPSAFQNDSFIDGTVSARFNVANKVVAAPSGTAPAMVLGMTLKDVKSLDENGYPLKFEPRKAAERDLVISGEAVPVVKRGVFLYSGITEPVGSKCAFGSGLAISDAGDGSLKVVAPGSASAVAKALGPKDANGFVLIDIKL
jgi:hypothetical protein